MLFFFFLYVNMFKYANKHENRYSVDAKSETFLWKLLDDKLKKAYPLDNNN